jgi:hypothetical protein
MSVQTTISLSRYALLIVYIILAVQVAKMF